MTRCGVVIALLLLLAAVSHLETCTLAAVNIDTVTMTQQALLLTQSGL